MNINTFIQTLSITAIPLIMAVVVHETAHGWIAYKFGDNTAKELGRLTLNPIPHIDPFGSIVLPILCMFLGGVTFGYAKPVPINYRNLKNPKENMIWIAAAGPASNLLLAVASAIGLKLLKSSITVEVSSWTTVFIGQMLMQSIMINVVLGVINLIPIPPADGGRITVGLLPHKQAVAYSKIEPVGMILLIIIFSYDPMGIFSKVVAPVIHTTINAIYSAIIL